MPAWLDDAVFYEIYPQTFRDANGDGIGDFRGIISRLDYVKSLGCTAIWLNPCFKSPFLDAGYDVSDYKKVAPRYGTLPDLVHLFERAHELGLKVLLDLVPGHTSWEHPWFRMSSEAKPNRMWGRYIWTDNVFKSPDNLGSIRGWLRGCSNRDGSAAVNFFSHQPCLNYGFQNIDDPSWQQSPDSPDALATREAIKDVMRFWMERGCDGFRVDMAGCMVKNDPDCRGTIALWQDFRQFLDREFPDCAIISEWGHPEHSLQSGFHMDFMLRDWHSHYGDLFHTENCFFSSGSGGDAKAFVDYYNYCYAPTKGKGMICIPSGNHDTIRMAHYLNPAEMKIAFAFLFSMPGAPFLYYGDEIGMRYLEGLDSVEGGYYRTGARSPMQWDDSPNAGFSSAGEAKLYIPIDPDLQRPTVLNQDGVPDSLLSEVRRLISIRHSEKALQSRGEIEFVYCQSCASPLVYRRRDGNRSILVVLNPKSTTASWAYRGKPGEVLYLNGKMPVTDGETMTVPGQTAAFFVEN